MLDTVSEFSLGGRVVVVTGGASGIGRSYSQGIARAGGIPVIADLDPAAIDRELERFDKAGIKALGVPVDIANPEDLARLAKAVDKEFGALDGLVNNAGLMSTLSRRSWLDIPFEEWEKVMHVNLGGLFLTCRALHSLLKVRGGSIVNISSTRALDGTPNRLHYTTSKAGSLGFTKALAREVGCDSIRVNAVAPGITLSDAQLSSSDSAYLDQLSSGRALARQQGPEDLVGAVVFLLSDAAQFITGQTLVVDGGKVMH
jgi:3-oxoacyl-[acyl-carrier protein] reductase